MKIKSALAIILIGFSLSSFSQKSWTLADCIEYAHANNIQIKRTQLQSDIAEVNLLQAKTDLFPNLNANLGRSYNYGRQVDEATNELVDVNFVGDSYSMNSSVNLFTGLRNYNNIKRTHYASLAAIQNVEKEKIEKTLEISTAYLQILFQQELLEVAKSQQGITNLQVVRTGKLVEAGSVAKGDLLEIQAQLANENLNVTNSTNQLQLSILSLVQLLDLDSTGGFNVVSPDTVDPLLLSAPSPVSVVYKEALNFLPHVKSAEFQLNSDEKTLLIQKGRRSPTISLSASLGTRYSKQLGQEATGIASYGDQFNENFSQSVGVGMYIPIFNRWEATNEISKARIRVEDSRYMLDQVKQQLFKNIQQAHNDAVSAHDKFASATDAVNSYRESFHYTEQKYNVGIVNTVEYSIAKNNFIKAQSELLQAKYEYVFANKILDFYRGIPISL